LSEPGAEWEPLEPWKHPNLLEVRLLNDRLSRKSVLINLLTLPLAATAAVATVSRASADAKSPQSAVQYQDKPKGDAKCSGCKFFEPGKDANAKGQCQVVAGDISPDGWCVVYSKKS
jgi:hypothetical protein